MRSGITYSNKTNKKKDVLIEILIKYVLRSRFTKVPINKKEKINLVSFFLVLMFLIFYFVVLYFNTINTFEEAY